MLVVTLFLFNFSKYEKKINEIICCICQNNIEKACDYFNFQVKNCLGPNSSFNSISQTSVWVEIPGDFFFFKYIL